MNSTEAVLQIGGTGFIGRALAARLVAAGHEVHVLGRRPASGLPAGVVVHCGDQGDRDVVRPLLARCGAVALIAGTTAPAVTCNTGSGKGGGLRELIAVVERVTGRTLAVNYRPARASDVGRIVLDAGLARASLSWVPGGSLEEGVTRTWRSLQ